METEGIVRQLVEFFFSGNIYLGFLQVFEVMAAILNGFMGLLGLDITFLGL